MSYWWKSSSTDESEVCLSAFAFFRTPHAFNGRVGMENAVTKMLYRILWWHLWMTCDRQPRTLVRRRQRKWAHRKCSHTGPLFACMAPPTAPPEDWRLSAPTKPRLGPHRCTGVGTHKYKVTSDLAHTAEHKWIANGHYCLTDAGKQLWLTCLFNKTDTTAVSSLALKCISVVPWWEGVTKSNTLFWGIISSWSKFKGLANQWQIKPGPHAAERALLSTSEPNLISLWPQMISNGWPRSPTRLGVSHFSDWSEISQGFYQEWEKEHTDAPALFSCISQWQWNCSDGFGAHSEKTETGSSLACRK